MNTDELKTLSGAEAFTWGDLNKIPRAVSEMSGPLVVKHLGEVVKMFPWHCFPMFGKDVGYERESVYVVDARTNRVLRIYTPDQYNEVIYMPEYRGIAIPV